MIEFPAKTYLNSDAPLQFVSFEPVFDFVLSQRGHLTKN